VLGTTVGPSRAGAKPSWTPDGGRVENARAIVARAEKSGLLDDAEDGGD
jgi:hypothetical protein